MHARLRALTTAVRRRRPAGFHNPSMDIATLFNNTLDNAIEVSHGALMTAKRLIKLALFRQERMVVIRVANWFDGRLHGRRWADDD